MPRLPWTTLRHAHSIDPLLPLLLRQCRTVPSAANELRWLREHVQSSGSGVERLRKLCWDRSRGIPLQYILGDQPFGDLSILCQRRVLIPRPETEAWVTYLATRIQHDHIIKQPTSTNGSIRILDLCTGSGCISLLLFALLSVQSIPLQILGVDISQAAVKLAQRNLIHNISKGFLPASALSHIDFPQGDVFAKDRPSKECEYDIVVSNPPYISPINYNRTTTRSVRNHEPKTALVPTIRSGSDEVVGDAFYPRIISIARDTKAKVLVMEVGDMHQAMRVVQLVGKSKIWQKMEIWADGVLDHHSPQIVTNRLGTYTITIRGKGEARAVAVWGRSGEGP